MPTLKSAIIAGLALAQVICTAVASYAIWWWVIIPAWGVGAVAVVAVMFGIIAFLKRDDLIREEGMIAGKEMVPPMEMRRTPPPPRRALPGEVVALNDEMAEGIQDAIETMAAAATMLAAVRAKAGASNEHLCGVDRMLAEVRAERDAYREENMALDGVEQVLRTRKIARVPERREEPRVPDFKPPHARVVPSPRPPADDPPPAFLTNGAARHDDGPTDFAALERELSNANNAARHREDE